MPAARRRRGVVGVVGSPSCRRRSASAATAACAFASSRTTDFGGHHRSGHKIGRPFDFNTVQLSLLTFRGFTLTFAHLSFSLVMIVIVLASPKQQRSHGSPETCAPSHTQAHAPQPLPLRSHARLCACHPCHPHAQASRLPVAHELRLLLPPRRGTLRPLVARAQQEGDV